MTKLLIRIREILKADSIISENNKDAEWNTLTLTALITSLAYLMMSILNVIQSSSMMLYFTAGSSFLLLIAFVIGKKKENEAFVSRRLFFF